MDTPRVSIERVVGLESTPEDQTLEQGRPEIRPLTFDDYLGQDKVKDELKVYVASALKRQVSLDHVLLDGPPGLGKTTLARIVAHAMGAPFFETRGPAIERQGDLAGILAGLPAGAVLFIDEIHRLHIKIEEVLYSAMEDFQLDSIIGQGPAARTVRMPLQPFTLIGATTRKHLLSKPLIDRFLIPQHLEFYDQGALAGIVARAARILGISVTEGGAKEIAGRSRGTPRIANRLLKRVWDYALAYHRTGIDQELAGDVLTRQGIDLYGLDRIDRQILGVVREQYEGGPVGIDALAATLNEDRATLEEVYEPYLVHTGFLARGPRGRILTAKGRAHMSVDHE